MKVIQLQTTANAHWLWRLQECRWLLIRKLVVTSILLQSQFCLSLNFCFCIFIIN